MHEKWLEISVDVPNEFVEPICQIFSKYSNNKIAIILILLSQNFGLENIMK